MSIIYKDPYKPYKRMSRVTEVQHAKETLLLVPIIAQNLQPSLVQCNCDVFTCVSKNTRVIRKPNNKQNVFPNVVCLK